jgi:hypoxanthine phosphoribosyltransferase
MGQPQVLLDEEKIRQRIAELAVKISADAGEEPLLVMCVLDNGFVFMSDLVRKLTCPVICEFVQMETRDTVAADGKDRREILYTPVADIKGKQILLVDAVLHTGVTLEHLMNQLLVKGAKSVKVAVLIDKPGERVVDMKPDYFGFEMQGKFLVGYGLGHRDLGRNLPYVADLGSAANAVPVGS